MLLVRITPFASATPVSTMKHSTLSGRTLIPQPANTLQTFISAWLQVAYSWSNFASGGDASYSEPTSSLVSLPTISPSSSATVATKIISATASPSVADPPSQNTPSKASEPSSADASGPPKPTNSHFSWSGAFDTKPSRYYLAPILFVLLGAGLTGR